MWVFLFFKNILRSWGEKVKQLARVSKLQALNPSCRIHYTSNLAETKLNRYNVIFPNVVMHKADIGAHSYIQKDTCIFNAQIGSFCSIASGVSIGLGQHHVQGVSTHPAFYLKHTPLVRTFSEEDQFISSKPISIGHDVWIGQNAVVLDGVTIGTGAIIAAGAVVIRDVEPYSIVGGVPAKVIKYRFSEETCKQLLSSAWWEQPDEWLQHHHKYFITPESFLTGTHI